jgi:ribosomal protein L40E
MKKMLTVAIVMCITISMFTMLAREVKATAMAQVWRDDFNYNTIDEVKAAGWNLGGGESMTTVGGGVVTLDNDYTVGVFMNFDGRFPSGITDFKVETEGMWVGRSYGTLQIVAKTSRHVYLWSADGYYSKYYFARDEVKSPFVEGYTPQMNTWMTLAIEKRGSNLYMYYNGELKYTYAEPDGTPDALLGVGIRSGWISTTQYDYISLEAPNEEIPLWMQWWFWTITALGAIVAVLAFTTVHYRKKPSVSKETSVMQSKTTQKANRVCPKCGANLPADSKFCGKCGTSLE